MINGVDTCKAKNVNAIRVKLTHNIVSGINICKKIRPPAARITKSTLRDAQMKMVMWKRKELLYRDKD